MSDAGEDLPAFYEDLAKIEEQFEDIDQQVLRKQYELSLPAYAARAAVLAKIDGFWPLVLEDSPPEFDQFVMPDDSRLFAESLTNLTVTRPELDADPANGHPRSLRLRFDFAPNDYFENTSLEKTFWYRRARDGWAGLVSEPVPIAWKSGRDLSKGLVEGARALWEARENSGAPDGREKWTAKDAPEYTALAKKVENWNAMNTSFFTWFGWVSGRRYVSAAESAEATAAHVAARTAGGTDAAQEKDEESLDFDAEDPEDDQDVEVHMSGDEVAITLAEDIWPQAIRYFTSAQEMPEDLSELDADEFDEDEEADAVDVDLASLVKENGKKPRASLEGQPPSKKQRS